MRTANINCARCTGIKARALIGLALLLAPGGLLLAAEPQAQTPPLRINADPAFPFSREIEAFAKANEAGPAIADATLFLGSSSIRLWDISGSFPDIGTVNRGFGGATTPDVLRYYKRLLPKARPRSILVYVGENDLAAGAAPGEVANNVLTLLKQLRADYPKAHIAYLSLKPSPIRWTLWPKMAAVNMTVAARSRVTRFDYLDVGRVLLAADGLPDASLFRPDGLHMNPRGYTLWTRLVDAYLDKAAAAELEPASPS
ncbi:GDSL-type esterase/lipase family protein [Sphingobium sp. JS3065]|jgi:lysophospholipase L1-like esterase|uniref:GDSL-type esterase/lipase family protein n=1 Tax=Sphingobium sp. JS3065 TaxID=2970925 RepID=UPI002265349D|nr:GDSL-type esterase/lipase family protein [Sphingobium sp. JS3065]UZW54822.1 GDSL-type esterase/lipase family protein [Sphingobium sp. JS3065]